MFTYSRHKYGDTQLSLKCESSEFEEIISVVVDKMPEFFLVSQFYSTLIDYLDQNALFKKENNTSYSKIILDYEQEKRVNEVLWNMILTKKLMINLFPCRRYSTSETELIKL